VSNINLLPWRTARDHRNRRLFFMLLVSCCCITLGFCYLSQAYVDFLITTQDKRNQYLQKEILILEKKITKIVAIKKDNKEITEQINLIHALQIKRNRTTRLLNALPDITPPGIYLTSVSFNRHRIDLQGFSDSHEQVSRMVRNIEQSNWFGDASLPSIVAGSTASVKRYKFSMNFIAFEQHKVMP